MPGLIAVSFHSTVRDCPSPSGPTAHVFVYADSPPVGPSSRTQIGRSESASVASSPSCANAAGALPSCASVSTTTATLGTARSPVFSTSSLSVVGSEIRCLAGNDASVTSSPNSPDGAFASWRSPPQPASASAEATATASRREFPIPAATIPAATQAASRIWRYPQVSPTVPVCG